MGYIGNFEEVYKQNWITALNLLLYWKLRDDEQMRIEKNMLKNIK
jgi:hypothetical protein